MDHKTHTTNTATFTRKEVIDALNAAFPEIKIGKSARITVFTNDKSERMEVWWS